MVAVDYFYGAPSFVLAGKLKVLKKDMKKWKGRVWPSEGEKIILMAELVKLMNWPKKILCLRRKS